MSDSHEHAITATKVTCNAKNGPCAKARVDQAALDSKNSKPTKRKAAK